MGLCERERRGGRENIRKEKEEEKKTSTRARSGVRYHSRVCVPAPLSLSSPPSSLFFVVVVVVVPLLSLSSLLFFSGRVVPMTTTAAAAAGELWCDVTDTFSRAFRSLCV